MVENGASVVQVLDVSVGLNVPITNVTSDALSLTTCVSIFPKRSV